MFSFGLETIKYLAVAAILVSIILIWVSFWGIKNSIPSENRQYFDPLPFKLRVLWPLVNFFAFYIGQNFSVDFLEKYAQMMRRAGISYLMTPEQFVGLRFLSGVISGLMYLFCAILLGSVDWLYLLCSMVIGYYLPFIAMRDMKAKREKLLVKALPTYLDYLTMSVQAGLNMSGAITQAADKGPEGPLKVEFLKLIRDMRAGMGRVDALKAMSERLDVGAISTFVSAVVQAERTGADVGLTLKIQADQRRTERFQKAEKLAMQAPVKLIFPLVAFIFPITFLIIFFPIGVKLLDAF